MVLDLGHDQVDHDDSTDYTGLTPPETVAGDTSDHFRLVTTPFTHATFIPPRPGSTYLIKSLSEKHIGKVITVLDGRIVLSFPEDSGGAHWLCIENDGWIGFRNVASGCYLGHDDNGLLVCKAEKHSIFEKMCVRQRSDEGYVLLLTHWSFGLWFIVLQPVGFKQNKLAKIETSATENGLAWEFVEMR